MKMHKKLFIREEEVSSRRTTTMTKTNVGRINGSVYWDELYSIRGT